MNEHDYKIRLLKRVCEYIGDNYIDFKVKDKDHGIVHLYQIGNEHSNPSMIYDVFEATVKIPSLGNEPKESMIKEKVVELFKIHFKE